MAHLILSLKKMKLAGGVTQVVESRKCQTPSSKPRNTRKKKTKTEESEV
jgi:hypothetical protein